MLSQLFWSESMLLSEELSHVPVCYFFSSYLLSDPVLPVDLYAIDFVIMKAGCSVLRVVIPLPDLPDLFFAALTVLAI